MSRPCEKVPPQRQEFLRFYYSNYPHPLFFFTQITPTHYFFWLRLPPNPYFFLLRLRPTPPAHTQNLRIYTLQKSRDSDTNFHERRHCKNFQPIPFKNLRYGDIFTIIYQWILSCSFIVDHSGRSRVTGSDSLTLSPLSIRSTQIE